MLKSLTAIFLISSPLFLFSQATSFEWAKSTGGESYDYGEGHCLDHEGNSYTIGYFSAEIDLDPGIDEFNVTPMGSDDIFVQKLDINGDFIWAKVFPGLEYASGQVITLDINGDLVMAGKFNGTVDFDPNAGELLKTSLGLSDIFVLKLDTDGNLIWVKTFGGPSSQWARAITTNPAGEVILAGEFTNTVDFDPGDGVYELTAMVSSKDNYILKLTTDGDFLWVKSIGGTGLEYMKSVAVDVNGAVYASGSFDSSVDFDPGVGIVEKTPIDGPSNGYFLKLDEAGEFEWVLVAGVAIGYAIKTGPSNTIYLAGAFGGTVDFDSSDEVVNLTSNGAADCFIQKFTLNGDLIWVKTFGDEGDDIIHALDVDQAGYVYSAGTYAGTVDFDPSDDEFELTIVDYEDVFVQKMNANGEFKWAKSIGGPSSNRVTAVNVDESGSVHLLGRYFETVDFDPETGPYNITSAGVTDVFLLKLGQDVVVGLEGNPENSLLIYPNPVIHALQISSQSEIRMIQVYSLNGSVLFTQNNLATTHLDIDLKDISEGTYIIEVLTENGRYFEKIMK